MTPLARSCVEPDQDEWFDGREWEEGLRDNDRAQIKREVSKCFTAPNVIVSIFLVSR